MDQRSSYPAEVEHKDFWDTLERVAKLGSPDETVNRPRLYQCVSDTEGTYRDELRAQPSEAAIASGGGLDQDRGSDEPSVNKPIAEDNGSATSTAVLPGDATPAALYGRIRTLIGDLDDQDGWANSEFLEGMRRKNEAFDRTGEIDMDLDKAEKRIEWSREQDDVVVTRKFLRKNRKRFKHSSGRKKSEE
jgi:hypothetical protein